MQAYLDSLKHVIEHGKLKQNRTGIDTLSVFGYQMRFDLRAGFPAVTTKKLAWRAVVSELLWFLEGSTDERRLAEILHGTRDPNKRTIWTANADAQGVALGYRNDEEVKELGPIYGYNWRNFGGVDQVRQLVNNLKNDPSSRRHILTAWNPPLIDKMALPPCHILSQFDVTDGELSCHLYQRSQDAPLGSPFNIASYSLLTHMLAQLAGLKVGDFVYSIGDMHIYVNQLDGVKEQLTREPLPLPRLAMPKFSTLEELLATKVDDYKLIEYNHHPEIKIPFAT